MHKGKRCTRIQQWTKYWVKQHAMILYSHEHLCLLILILLRDNLLTAQHPTFQVSNFILSDTLKVF